MPLRNALFVLLTAAPVGALAEMPPTAAGSVVLPALPAPSVGANASPQDYLRAAAAALAMGHPGETEQALEMAQTRLLDRSVALFQTQSPSPNPAVAQIAEARRALAVGDRMRCAQLIEAAMPNAAAVAH